MDNPVATVYLDNIKHNANIIKKRVGSSKLVAVLKADAYGHGAVKVATHLDNDNNISMFGVSRFSELHELRQHGIIKPVLLLEGVLYQDQLSHCASNNAAVVVQNFEQLQLIEDTKLSKPLTIWLKFTTGLNRLGFRPEFSDDVLLKLNKLIKQEKINHGCVIMTHFACADDLKSDCTRQQLAVFNSIRQACSAITGLTFQFSAANTAAIFGWPESYFDFVRPGIGLYGSTQLEYKRSDLNLKSSMVLNVSIIAINIVKQGERVGYGAKWQAHNDTKVGIIACGYADCYPRGLSDKRYVYVQNQKCKIIGQVSMDMMAIDLSCFKNDEDISVGDIVELWGDNISIDEAAASCDTISNELYCRITKRVETKYV